MLRYRADRQTAFYMIVASGLLIVQWHQEAFCPPLYALTLALAFAISIMHHNHRHLAMWRNDLMNSLTDHWYAVFQGHPGFVFTVCHEGNHHRYCNRAGDLTRTYRYRDDNDLMGLLRHPIESAIDLAPVIARHVANLRRNDAKAWRRVMSEYATLSGVVALALIIDARKALLYLVLPQCFSLYWLLAANYLQHAHTDETKRFSSSRNFLGLVNTLCFNIGLHTAHHMRGSLHWSELPELHRRIADNIDSRLMERSLAWYCLRVFFLSVLIPGFRSKSLRR